MKKLPAFSLIEALISLAIGTIFLAASILLVSGMVKWYPATQTKAQFNDQARRLDMHFRKNFVGVGFYEIYDWYPQTIATSSSKTQVSNPTNVHNTSISGNMLVLAYTDRNAPTNATSSQAALAGSVINPNIIRIAGYFVDASNARAPVLRFFDSGDPYAREAQNYTYSQSMLDQWFKRFQSPTGATWNSASTVTQTIYGQGLLPPASLMSSFPIICQLDPVFVNNSLVAWTSPAVSTTNMTLNYQVFYPQTNNILMNIAMRYGSGNMWYACPLTLTLALHL